MIKSKKCCVIEEGRIVVRKEMGKCFRIENVSAKKIQVCRVDGCLIPDNNINKCDYMFVHDVDAVSKVALVELKGTDHIHALEQLVSTAEKLNLKSYNVRLISYIIGSPSPKIQTRFQKEVKRLANRYIKAKLEFPVRKNDLFTVKW